MAQGNACQQFEVGSAQWTECVEDAATGGGLMPWIVVVPLAVMVVGMFIGFARQFSAAGRERARAHGAAGTAGTWLIFVALIELAIGAGSAVAAKEAPGAGGGYDLSAVILLGVGILLLAIGLFLKAKGRRRARIYHSGMPGEALIRDIRETGTMVNNQPMYEFDLDVSGSSFAPTSTTHREVVPLWMASRVAPDTKVPVKVDPSNPARLIFDWERFRSSPLGAAAAASLVGPSGFADDAADAAATFAGVDDVRDAMQTAGELRGQTGSGWHVGKAIGAIVLLFVIAVVGGGLYFVWSIFSTVTDTTAEVTEQVDEALGQVGNATSGATGATLEVARKGVGFSIAVPVAWNDVTGAVGEDQGAIFVDVALKPQPPANATLVIGRSTKYLKDPAPPGTTIAGIVPQIEAELGGNVKRTPTSLDGEKAFVLDVPVSANGLRARQVVTMRGGQVFLIALTAPRGQWGAAVPGFQDVLSSWRWS